MGALGDDNVVEDFDVEYFQASLDFLGELFVVGGGAVVVTGVVVYEDDCWGVGQYSSPGDVFQVGRCWASVSEAYEFVSDDFVIWFEEDCVEVFFRPGSEEAVFFSDSCGTGDFLGLLVFDFGRYLYASDFVFHFWLSPSTLHYVINFYKLNDYV